MPVIRTEYCMNEKETIEKQIAEGFLDLYNCEFNTTFKISEMSDAPDVRCKDSNGKELNLEITQTEDRDLDIKAMLGRSNHKNIEALEEHNKKVAEGKEKPQFISFSESLEQLATCINTKIKKQYGTNTALVVRDTSGLDWKWNLVIGNLKEKLNLEDDRFDKGIWILNRAKTKLFPVTERAT